MTFKDRLAHAWSVFRGRDPTDAQDVVDPHYINKDLGPSYSIKPDRVKMSFGNEKSIVAAIYNRIALDVAAIDIRHVRSGENGMFDEEINSGLNQALSIEPNKDQTPYSFKMDLVLSMFDEGCVAIVPYEFDKQPINNNSYDVISMRVGKIIEWYPDNIKVSLFNDKINRRQELIVPKKLAYIIENPFYAVMNERNSVGKRLVRKLNLLDIIDEQSGSGKLDLIIQLPYVVNSPRRKDQAEVRRTDLENQLKNSKYGVAYTDGTEHITQLNRPVENNLMNQIEYLTNLFYSQLGITPEIMNGTADEDVMQRYEQRVVVPILNTICSELRRKYLTKTARTQGQDIVYFREPFKLIPISKLPDYADKLTRNEIMSSNEFRSILGLKPSNDPRADELINKNISHSEDEEKKPNEKEKPEETKKGDLQNGG